MKIDTIVENTFVIEVDGTKWIVETRGQHVESVEKRWGGEASGVAVLDFALEHPKEFGELIKAIDNKLSSQ